jgi:hypothetical protein
MFVETFRLAAHCIHVEAGGPRKLIAAGSKLNLAACVVGQSALGCHSPATAPVAVPALQKRHCRKRENAKNALQFQLPAITP